MNVSDPMLAELVALRKTVAELVTNVALNSQIASSLQRTLDDVRQSAVPRREWELGRLADKAEVASVAKDVGDLQENERAWTTFKRQILLAVGVAAFSALISVGVALAGLLLGGP